MEVHKFSGMEFDTLRELGNIGANGACNSLSKMLGERVDIQVTNAQIVDIVQVPRLVGGPETIVGAIYVRILSNIPGAMLLIFSRDSTLSLVDMLLGRDVGTTKTLRELDESAFRELGNILIGSYLSAVADFLHIKIDQSIPHMSFDMVGAITDFVAIEIAKFSERAVLIQTEFRFEKIEGDIFMIIDPTSAEELLKSAQKLLGGSIG
ncbi:MAG: chemotaxis protein CheC [Candidatus Hydrothermarchaeales archaeon]